MRAIQSPSTDPRFNLALEQYIFDQMPRNRSYLMLWRNDQTIVVGKHQDTFAEINADYVRANQIQVVRRLSGGGAVYHDLGNVNFTFIADHTGSDFDFSTFCRPVIWALESLEAQAVSTGLLDILLPVRDLAALERAEQNEGEVTRLSERYGVVGVHMFCPSTPDAAAHCRNFAPLYAIPEEAATGTSNGALTYYLYRRGLTAAGAENRFVQGEKMGKPSAILSRLTDGGDGVKVQVGGRAVLALRCELL